MTATHDVSIPHAEVRLEFEDASPKDFSRKKKELRFFLVSLYKQALLEEKDFVRFVMIDCVVPYASMTDHGVVAGCNFGVILSADKSLLYNTKMSDDEWRDAIEFCIQKLGKEFRQFRLHVAYSEREVEILQKICNFAGTAKDSNEESNLVHA